MMEGLSFHVEGQAGGPGTGGGPHSQHCPNLLLCISEISHWPQEEGEQTRPLSVMDIDLIAHTSSKTLKPEEK